MWLFGRRTRAATAALLSSLFPGLGQLYNRDWTKAAAMIGLTIALFVAVNGALVGIADTAVAVAHVSPLLGPADGEAFWSELLPAMAHPGVQEHARKALLPPVFALCGIVLWSMVDAYRRARR